MSSATTADGTHSHSMTAPAPASASPSLSISDGESATSHAFSVSALPTSSHSHSASSPVALARVAELAAHEQAFAQPQATVKAKNGKPKAKAAPKSSGKAGGRGRAKRATCSGRVFDTATSHTPLGTSKESKSGVCHLCMQADSLAVTGARILYVTSECCELGNAELVIVRWRRTRDETRPCAAVLHGLRRRQTPIFRSGSSFCCIPHRFSFSCGFRS